MTGTCPCGLRAYDNCCGRFVDGAELPSTAEELMRSRYTAFVLARADYLLATWHPATRPESLDLDDGITWTGLEVLDTDGGQPGDLRGVVEFRAHHVDPTTGGSAVLHERSRFRRNGEQWLYVRGKQL